MASSCVLSASKLRRARSAATRQRLFAASEHTQTLSNIQAQLAMLTSAVNCMCQCFSSLHTTSYGTSICLDPRAPAFVPSAQASVNEEVEGDNAAKNDTRAPTNGREVSFVRDKGAAPIGSWEPLDPWLFLDKVELACVSQTCARNLRLVGDSTPFFSFVPAGVCHDGTDDEGSGVENHFADFAPTAGQEIDVPEFSASQVQVIIDITAAKLSESPKGQSVPVAAASAIVKELKATYEGCGGTMFSRSQVMELMELTGRMFGDAADLKSIV